MEKPVKNLIKAVNVCCLDLLWPEVESQTNAHVQQFIDYHACVIIGLNSEDESRITNDILCYTYKL